MENLIKLTKKQLKPFYPKEVLDEIEEEIFYLYEDGTLTDERGRPVDLFFDPKEKTLEEISQVIKILTEK